MGYGSTYSSQPRKSTEEELSEQNSLISLLCNDAGYSREEFKDTELESKIDISCSKGTSPVLTLGESLEFVEPYSRDKILVSSKSIHSCYAFTDKNKGLLPAFTKVEKEGQIKIKIKEEMQQINKKGIILLRRDEKHLMNLNALEVNKEISQIARKSNLPLQYVGKFCKQDKEAFVFNPTSGRIFVVSTNLCDMELNQNTLYQLEIEYYGKINGFLTAGAVEEEMAELTRSVLKYLPKEYSGKNSTKTKFEWLVENLHK